MSEPASVSRSRSSIVRHVLNLEEVESPVEARDDVGSATYAAVDRDGTGLRKVMALVFAGSSRPMIGPLLELWIELLD